MRPSLVLMLAILLLPAQALPQQILHLGKPDDPESEISSRVLVEAYSRLGIEINPQKMPAQRSLNESNAGNLDGEVNRIAGIQKAYPNLVRVPVAVNLFEAVVFSKRQRFTTSGKESLQPYTIAIRIGSKYAEELTEGLNVTKFPDFEKVFALLAEERYDIGIASRITGLHQIKEQALRGIVALEPPLAVFELYHYLHRKHRRLVPRITRELDKMREDGSIDRIRARYIDGLLKSE